MVSPMGRPPASASWAPDQSTERGRPEHSYRRPFPHQHPMGLAPGRPRRTTRRRVREAAGDARTAPRQPQSARNAPTPATPYLEGENTSLFSQRVTRELVTVFMRTMVWCIVPHAYFATYTLVKRRLCYITMKKDTCCQTSRVTAGPPSFSVVAGSLDVATAVRSLTRWSGPGIVRRKAYRTWF